MTAAAVVGYNEQNNLFKKNVFIICFKFQPFVTGEHAITL